MNPYPPVTKSLIWAGVVFFKIEDAGFYIAEDCFKIFFLHYAFIINMHKTRIEITKLWILTLFVF